MSLKYFSMWLSIFLYCVLFKGGSYQLKALFSEIWNVVSAFMLIPTAGSQSCWAHTERSSLSTESIQPCERIGRTALQKCESVNLLLFSSVFYLLAQVFLRILLLNLTYVFGTTVILSWFLLNWSYHGDCFAPRRKTLTHLWQCTKSHGLQNMARTTHRIPNSFLAWMKSRCSSSLTTLPPSSRLHRLWWRQN